MKITREIKASILVIISILLMIWGYSYLKGKNLFINYVTYYVEYENVEGLSESAPITINGLVVGKVSDISINETTGKLLVELQVKTDFPISKSSVVSIYEPSFIGGRQILINPNFEDKTLAENGQKFAGNVKLGLASDLTSKLEPLEKKIERLLTNADVLISNVNSVLDEKSQQNIKKSIEELSKTITEFRKTSAGINSIMDENKVQLKSTVSNFNKVSNDFAKLSDTLVKANIGKVIKDLDKTLLTVNSMLKDLESGKGTMGKLMKDEAMYKNLTNSSKELEKLLADLRNNPKRYVNISVFGKKEIPYTDQKTDSVKK